MSEGAEWLRARGLGRERLAAYLAEYLTELGFVVEKSESTEPAVSVVSGELKRMNPAVPDGMRTIRVRFVPTSGGTAGSWELPQGVPEQERARVDRFLRELVLHLERTVRTESHGTAKVQIAPPGHLPWDGPRPVDAAPSASRTAHL
ncbi:MAG TPA: hypothetical protein VGV89_04335 [Thermoplasmata archaeon]|nr:hypothetical protein [Thermoplasmata archaeon]